jgi:hypothetical protein
VKYGYTLLMEITAHIPVAIPDTVNLLSGLKQPGGIIKDRNRPHLSGILKRLFIGSLPESRFCNKNWNKIPAFGNGEPSSPGD